MFSKGLTLTRNRFVANRSHRAYGLLLQSVEDTLISANEIAGNTLGLFMENGHGNRVLDNRIAGNHVGIRVSDSSDANVFAGNRFTGNIHPVETTGDNRSNRWAARRPRQRVGRRVARSTSIATASPICRTASSICSAGCAGRSRPSACSPAARRSACCASSTRASRCPAAGGIVDPAPLVDPAVRHRSIQMIDVTGLARPTAAKRVLHDLSLSVAPARSRCSSAPTAAASPRRCGCSPGCRRRTPAASLLAGHDVAADPAAAQAGLSFLPQSPRFHARLTVAQILAFYARLRGLPARRVGRGGGALGARRAPARRRPAGCRAAPGSGSGSPSSTCPTRRILCSTSPA